MFKYKKNIYISHLKLLSEVSKCIKSALTDYMTIKKLYVGTWNMKCCKSVKFFYQIEKFDTKI